MTPSPMSDEGKTRNVDVDFTLEWMVRAADNCKKNGRADAAALWHDAIIAIHDLRKALTTARAEARREALEEASHRIYLEAHRVDDINSNFGDRRGSSKEFEYGMKYARETIRALLSKEPKK